VRLITLALATWRLTQLFTVEDGPFKMFYKIRKSAGIMHDKYGDVIGDDGSFLAGLLSCFWCTSVWMGMILVTIRNTWLETMLAASAGAILIEEMAFGERKG
jgi:hypothetical protein